MTAIPQYRDWSNINIERELKELHAVQPDKRSADQERKLMLVEYEVFDRGLTHLYVIVDPTWDD